MRNLPVVCVEIVPTQYLVVVLVVVSVNSASTELQSNSYAVLAVIVHVKSADSPGTINTFGCCPICGCECGVTFQEETRFWGRVIQPETQYCTPCCRCGLIRLTPFSRETCKFPCPIRIPTGCFPATASVTLENGKQIAMAELQVGDQVKTRMFMNITLLVILVDLYGFTVIS